ncbi:MAG: glycosyltransferase [Candidatus Aminicenantes bacterium]|nr:glycosyltransferase [Candidatus Aminicenantes bacterium]
MSRFKVLASAYACNPSGALCLHPGEDLTGWRLVGQLARFHDVWVITHQYNGTGIAEALAGEPLPNVCFHFVELPRTLKWLYRIEFGQRIYYYLWQIKAWRMARKLHREVHFDVAHHLTFGNDWIPSFIGAFLPIPFIWGPVGGGQKTPKPLLKEYSLYGRFAEFARNCAQGVGRRMLVRKRCLKKARAVLVCNRETQARMPLKYQDKILYFPVNGIVAEDIKDGLPEPRRNGQRFKVITAGRLHRLKGFSLAVRAFRAFSEKHPASEMKIIGSGPEEESLRRLISDLGLEDKVRILPWLPRHEVLANMRSSDVFLFPSFRDGGGAVVVEAMGSGIPVVVLDSGGPGAHVSEAWGIKMAPASRESVVREMTAALETLYSDRALGQRLGAAGRKRALEFYAWDRLGDRMRDIYENAVSRKGLLDLVIKDR